MHNLPPNDFSIPYPKMCALECQNTVCDSASSHVKNLMIQSPSIGLPMSHRVKPTSECSSSNTVSCFSSASSSGSTSWLTSSGFSYFTFATMQLSLNFLSMARLTSNGVSFIEWPLTIVPCLSAKSPDIDIVTSISFVFLFFNSSWYDLKNLSNISFLSFKNSGFYVTVNGWPILPLFFISSPADLINLLPWFDINFPKFFN